MGHVVVEGDAEMFATEIDRSPVDLGREGGLLEFFLDRAGLHFAVAHGIQLSVGIKDPADLVAGEQGGGELRPCSGGAWIEWRIESV